MRTKAEERPLAPCPTWSLSMTTILPALRFARWNAIEAPITPAPRITMSADFGMEWTTEFASELEVSFAEVMRPPPDIVLSSSRAEPDERRCGQVRRLRRRRDVRPPHKDIVRQRVCGIAPSPAQAA